MLQQINLEEILFLDIETVPQAENYELLDEEDRMLWAEKSRFIREKQAIDIDKSYEQAGIYAEFGKIICISVGYFSMNTGSRVLRITSFNNEDESSLLTDFADLLNKNKTTFRILCAHNGNSLRS